MQIRPSNSDDLEAMIEIWLRSVRTTHKFLTEDDIQFFLPLVRQGLPTIEVWVLCDDDNAAIGFMGLEGNKVEALFLDPDHFRRGGGRLLLHQAEQLKGPLAVDVNEQNPDACRFYEACGFVIHHRSDFDSTGRPFPLLHMRQDGA